MGLLGETEAASVGPRYVTMKATMNGLYRLRYPNHLYHRASEEVVFTASLDATY